MSDKCTAKLLEEIGCSAAMLIVVLCAAVAIGWKILNWGGLVGSH